MSFATKLFPLAIALLLLSACKKDTEIKTVTASVAFDFKGMANHRPLFADTAWYKDASGDSFNVSTYNYYITDIKFIRNDGSVYAQPQSHYLIKHLEGQTSFTVNTIPPGTYTGITFLIGVDNIFSSSAQTGALDPQQGMYWGWETGYVFFKLEGHFKSKTFPDSTEYAMHIGTSENLETCLFTFDPTPILARAGKQSQVHYIANIDEVFTNPINLDMSNYHAVSGGPLALKISNNYKDMFSISGIEN